MKKSEERVVPQMVQPKNAAEGFRLTDSKEVNAFLEEKALELAKIKSGASLQLGRIFKEVHNRLSSHYGGTYYSWLEKNGFSRNTAYRHRKRYEFFEKSQSDYGRDFISALPYRMLDDIYRLLKVDDIVRSIDSGMTRDELESAIESSKDSMREPACLSRSLKTKYSEVAATFRRISPEKIPEERIGCFEKDIDQISKLIRKWI